MQLCATGSQDMHGGEGFLRKCQGQSAHSEVGHALVEVLALAVGPQPPAALERGLYHHEGRQRLVCQVPCLHAHSSRSVSALGILLLRPSSQQPVAGVLLAPLTQGYLHTALHLSLCPASSALTHCPADTHMQEGMVDRWTAVDLLQAEPSWRLPPWDQKALPQFPLAAWLECR